jgi:predicted nucleotidyltransferase
MVAPLITSSTAAIADICRRHHIERLSVFGSAGRNEDRADSDIDLLVEFDSHALIGLVEYAQLRQELQDLLGREIDLVTKHSLRPELRDSILGSAAVLYAK